MARLADIASFGSEWNIRTDQIDQCLLSRCEFRDGSGARLMGNIQLENCVFDGTGGGSELWLSDEGSMTFVNCVISEGYELHRDRPEVVGRVQFHLVASRKKAPERLRRLEVPILRSRSTVDRAGGKLRSQESCISNDPLFADDGTYRLLDESPCCDAGDWNPAYNDRDGSRNDIGVYGGPGAVQNDSR